MAKVYSLHLLALNAGSSGEQFESYYRDIHRHMTDLSGVTFRLVKGDRGDRAGKYALLIEIESAERRQELFPTPGPGAQDMSPEFQKWMAENGPAMARWSEYATPIDVIYTDYVDVSG